MFFGLYNSPPTFQNMMDEIFIMGTHEGWIIIYMDNILIFSKDRKELEVNTRQVLQKLKDNDLFLNLDKCVFDAEEVKYLGMVIWENQIKMEWTKLEGIVDWPTPTSVKQVWSFLGFGNFYRKFIGHYANIARPLNDLTKKNHPWIWADDCQQAFKDLKAAFIEAPILLMPDTAKPSVVESDASKWATGGVLWRWDDSRNWHPCGFISHSFDQIQRNYEIYDCELLGIVCTLKTWHHYLQGSQFPTVILSDHKNLIYFRTAQKLNCHQVHWSLFLSEFDLKLSHVPESWMIFFFFLFNNLYTAVSKYMCGLASMYQLNQKKNKRMSDWLGSSCLILGLDDICY